MIITIISMFLVLIFSSCLMIGFILFFYKLIKNLINEFKK